MNTSAPRAIPRVARLLAKARAADSARAAVGPVETSSQLLRLIMTAIERDEPALDPGA